MKWDEIKPKRKSLRISRIEFASLLGVSENYLYLVETGKKPFSDKLRRKIEALLEEGVDKSGSINTGAITGDGNAVGHHAQATHQATTQLDRIETRLSNIEALLIKLLSK